MFQFHGKNINTELDLLRVKVQAYDFIKALKFNKVSLEKLSDFIYELTKDLVLNQQEAYIAVNMYRLEHSKGIEIYVQTQCESIEQVQDILRNDYNFEKKGIFFDKSTGFLDVFEFKKETQSKTDIHIIKLLT